MGFNRTEEDGCDKVSDLGRVEDSELASGGLLGDDAEWRSVSESELSTSRVEREDGGDLRLFEDRELNKSSVGGEISDLEEG